MNMDACKCTCDMTSVNFCVAAFSVHSLCSLLELRNCTLNSTKRIPTCFLARQLHGDAPICPSVRMTLSLFFALIIFLMLRLPLDHFSKLAAGQWLGLGVGLDLIYL